MSSRSFDLSQINNYIDSTGAVKLNGQASSYYLDYNNFTNTPTIPTNNNQLTNGAGYTTNTGTVTSVATTVPTGFAISGSPITTSGTFSITYSAGYQGYTSTEASKLAGIEAGATADQTASEILTAIKTVDGAASGLDADLLDGNHATAFYLATNPSGYTTNTGTVTSVSATVPTGFAISGSPVTTSGTLAITYATGYQGYTSTEASKLAGIEAGATGDQTASEILTLIKTVDGSGSGLDADTLDGIQASSFSQTSHNHTLDGLSNTTITSNTSGEILKWNGSAWVNNTLAEAGIQPAGSYLTGNQTITLSGDLTGSGTTSINAQIAANVVGANELNVSGNGTAGQALLSDGDGSFSWGSGGGGGGGITFTKKTTTYTAAAGEGIIADTTGGAWTLTLPATPSTGDQVIVGDGGSWASNNLTVARNGQTIESVADDYLLDISGAQVQFIYDGTTWQVYSNPGIVHSNDSLIIYNSSGTALKTIYSA
jgi:hypothetical protein